MKMKVAGRVEEKVESWWEVWLWRRGLFPRKAGTRSTDNRTSVCNNECKTRFKGGMKEKKEMVDICEGEKPVLEVK